MKFRYAWCTTVFSVILAFAISFASAQDQNEEYQKAFDAFHSGRYLEARDLFRPLLTTESPQTWCYVSYYFETYSAVGNYSGGMEDVDRQLRAVPGDPHLLNARAVLLVETGDYELAEEIFTSVLGTDPQYWKNYIDLAQLLETLGRRRDAERVFNAVYVQYRNGAFQDGELISLGGVASAGIERFHDANEAFRTAYRLSPKHAINLKRWADLFADKFNRADAERTYGEAIEINPNMSDLYTGLAAVTGSFSAQEELAEQALQFNPKNIAALNILSELNILDSEYRQAEQRLKSALEINPSNLRTLGNLASVYHLREEESRFLEIENLAKKVTPICGDFYIRISENCAIRFRYRDALEFSGKAVEHDRRNWKAYSLHGANLLRLGRSDDAKRYLDFAFERDAFDLFAKNNLELIDEYQKFDTLESEHFTLKIHQDESGVLGADILELAEEAYTEMVNRYLYVPDGKIQLEAYNDRLDFAVRIAGIPNLDLLGVCFGDIVAFNTPDAEEERPYNWARTLWHELAHVMTLGLSEHRVPRWLTEGLSVYEERLARPEWAREMDIELYAAYDAGALLKLSEFDRGFTRPKFPGQIMLSYFQASKFVEFLVSRDGFTPVTKLLRNFSERKGMELSFQEALGASVEEVNDQFFSYISQGRKEYQDIVSITPSLPGSSQEVSIMQKLFTDSGSTFFSTLKKANEDFIAGDLESAESGYLEALEIHEGYIEVNNPYSGLAAVYEKQGETEKRIAILEDYLEISEYGAAAAREVADYYSENGDNEKAAYYYGRLFHLDPYDMEARTRLAEVLKNSNSFEQESRQRRVILALNPVDRPTAQYNLALSLFNSGKPVEAKRETLKALELAPGFRDAQRLLQQCASVIKE